MTNESKHPGSSRAIGRGILMIVVAAILYLLSLGAAVRWYDICTLSTQKAIEIVYAPLEWLYDKNQWCSPILDLYVNMWER